MTLSRSWLFVPGHKERMVTKAQGLNVDAIMLDIEDGVPPAEKDLARKLISRALEDASPGSGPAKFVRINAIGHPRMEADLEAVVYPGLDGLVLPKVDSAEDVHVVERFLDSCESERGLKAGAVSFLVAIESPKGLFQAPCIASCSPRVVGLLLGAEDFGLELGLPLVREKEARELIYARSHLALAAASAHVQAVDGVWPDIADAEGLLADTYQARRLGFTGKSLIHPSQIEPINSVFRPSPEEVEYCRRVIAAFDEATSRGDGSIAFGGQLIDLPIVERARRTMVLSESLGSES